MKKIIIAALISALLTVDCGAVSPFGYVNGYDAELLARLIEAETGGRDWYEMVACGALCMKRVKSGAHPDTVAGVVFEQGLYASVSDGSIYCVPSELARRAAIDAICGMLG